MLVMLVLVLTSVSDSTDTSASIYWRVRSGAVAIHCPRLKFYEPIQVRSKSFKIQHIEVRRTRNCRI